MIAHDHRHNSERFAALTAAAFLRKGIKVYRYKGIGCTPLVPFGVKHFGAAGGVMITGRIYLLFLFREGPGLAGRRDFPDFTDLLRGMRIRCSES